MANCSTLEISTMKSVRSFLQVPNPNGCTRKTLYYGKDCQFMEVDGVVRNIRNAGTPIRTWDRRSQKWCTVGSTEAPPDNSQFTVRFRIPCGKGIPLPHTVGKCRVRIINNVGVCNSDGAAVSGWSDYAEVIDAWLLTESRGRRSSYDGTDDPLTSEWSLELLNIFDVSTVSFSPLTIISDKCTTATNMKFNNAVFGCFNGCGQRSCGCSESCDDGTRTFYIPMSCTGATAAQYVMHSTNGVSIKSTTILTPSSFVADGAVAADFPQIAISGNTLYVMGFKVVPSLWELTLDSNGNPKDVTELTRLDYDANGVVLKAGEPGSMVVQGSDIHMIVADATNGDRFYTYSESYQPKTGARYTFPVAASPVSKLAVCGTQMIVGGKNGAVYVSEDEGASWTLKMSPSNIANAQILSAEISDGKYWITTITGKVYYSADGNAWTEIDLPGTTGKINDIAFQGDDIGWIVGDGKLVQSTWLGGLDRSDWTNKEQRIYGIPSTFTTILHAATPQCADADLASNTVLLTGIDNTGKYVAYMGRPLIAGI